MDNTHRKLLVARTLVDLSAEDLPVRVMNLTNGYVSLKKGAEIALCEPIGCVRNLEHQSVDGDIKNDLPASYELPEHLGDLYSRSKVSIGEENETKLAQLLAEFQDVFSRGPNDLGSTDITMHKIDVGEAKPIKQHARRLH